MKIIPVFVVVGVLVAVGFFIFFSSNQKPVSTVRSTSEVQTKEVAKAAFAIFTNGTFRVFTSPMYHNLSPDVYIDSSTPSIVQVKKVGVTWDQFFETLPMKLTKECLTTGTGQEFCTKDSQILKFYLNGSLETHALDKEINSGDRLLVSYGDESDSEIEEQFQRVPVVK